MKTSFASIIAHFCANAQTELQFVGRLNIYPIPKNKELNHHRLEGGWFRCCGWKPPKAP